MLQYVYWFACWHHSVKGGEAPLAKGVFNPKPAGKSQRLQWKYPCFMPVQTITSWVLVAWPFWYPTPRPKILSIQCPKKKSRQNRFVNHPVWLKGSPNVIGKRTGIDGIASENRPFQGTPNSGSRRKSSNSHFSGPKWSLLTPGCHYLAWRSPIHPVPVRSAFPRSWCAHIQEICNHDSLNSARKLGK